jgi:hypothetical protein
MRLFAVLPVVALFAACGSDTPTAQVQPPVPPPAIGSVELLANSGQLFTGHVVPAERLVARVLDVNGDLVTDAVLSFLAPAGWTVQGNMLMVPVTEMSGAMRVTATRPASPTAPRSAGPVSAAAATITSNAIDLGGVFDLRALGLTTGGQLICQDPSDVQDSILYAPTAVDSVVYQPTGGQWEDIALGSTFRAVVFFAFDATVWSSTPGYPAVSSSRNLKGQFPISKQLPDTLLVGAGTRVLRTGLMPTWTLPPDTFCAPTIRGMLSPNSTPWIIGATVSPTS